MHDPVVVDALDALERYALAPVKPRTWALALLMVVSACSTPAAEPTRVGDVPPRSDGLTLLSFDLDRVKSNFEEECSALIAVDETFCDQVDIDGMTADGTILNVPTALNPEATDRALAICEVFASVHFDGATGDDLGYETIGILDMDGGNAAACSVSS
jgi:hypothetical protein